VTAHDDYLLNGMAVLSGVAVGALSLITLFGLSTIEQSQASGAPDSGGTERN